MWALTYLAHPSSSAEDFDGNSFGFCLRNHCHKAVKESLALRWHEIHACDPNSKWRIYLIDAATGYRVPNGVQVMAVPIRCPE